METSSTTISTNQSQPTSSMSINWIGTIKAVPTIEEAFKSKINIDIIEAIQIAQASIGANSSVKDAILIPAHGSEYKVFLVDGNMKQYNVFVDPGKGQVLLKEEVPLWYDDHEFAFGNHWSIS